MPVLFRNIEASVLDNFITSVNYMSVSGLVGEEDYIKLFSLEAFLQNFSKINLVEPYGTPREFGLIRNKNETFSLLEISY